MPQTAIHFNKKIVSWNLHMEDLSKHMSIVDDKGTITIGYNNEIIHYNQKFIVNINQKKM
jgi:hypothetical protein